MLATTGMTIQLCPMPSASKSLCPSTSPSSRTFPGLKPFTHQQIDTLELMLERLYRDAGISDKADFSALEPEDWPIAEDLYAVLEDALNTYDREDSPSVSQGAAGELLLGLHSMCRGRRASYFNGRTNITSARFLRLASRI